MSGLLRPTFSEGQILGAADLNAQVSYDHQTAILHEATEHVWGVAQGLTLTAGPSIIDPSTTLPYVDVTLNPGRAVDRLGRSIVVTAAMPVDPALFKAQIASPNNGNLYPVFLQALDVSKPGDTQPGKCSVTLATRIEESFQIVFGNPGTELGVLQQGAATVDTLFGTPASTDMVLVGWVKFDDTIANKEGRFTAVATEGNSTSIRYVGVVASDVVAAAGTLTLHTRPSGQRFMLSLTEDDKGGCKLEFGKQDGSNPIISTFSVDEKGNIKYAGTLSPTPQATVLAVSGVAYDGVTLPLPDGVTDDKLQSGAVRVHVMLTPLPPPNVAVTLPSGANGLPFVETCEVDDKRKLSCTVRWVNPTNPTADFLILSSGCTYLIVASGA